MAATATASRKDYELAVLYQLQPDPAAAAGLVEKLITELNGQIETKDDWGAKPLAYPIRNQDQAHYVFYRLKLKPESIITIQNRLNISDGVLRHLISRIDLRRQQQAAELQKRLDQRRPVAEAGTGPATS